MTQTVTPLPAIGDVIAGQDVAGRELRISGHPDADRSLREVGTRITSRLPGGLVGRLRRSGPRD